MNTAILRSRILDMAIRGQLVPQDPNEGTADDLLKTIAAQRGKPITPITDNVPFDIPENWRWVKLGDIAESNIGLTYRPSEIVSDGIPVYRSNNIKEGKINHTELVCVNSRILDKQLLQNGDILICARNGSKRLVGKSAIVSGLQGQASFGAFMAVCRSNYNSWIYNILNTEYFKRYLDASNSTTINQVTQKMLLELPLPLPPLSEQHRIVAKVEELLSEVDKIEQAQADITQAATILRSRVLDMAIKGELTHSNTEEWESMTLGNVCSFQNGYAFDSHDYCKEGIPLIRIGDIQAGHVTFDKCVYVKKNVDDVFLVQKGDLLIAMSGASTGKIGIYEEDRKAYLNQRVGNIRVKDDSKIISQYRDLFLKLQSETIYKLAYGGAQPNISGKMILSLPLNLPPLSEQHRIVAKIEQLLSQIDKLVK